MVRPIEITDAISKAEAVQRIQQSQKVQPEAALQFQKTLTDKLSAETKQANPVPQGDQVLLHVDEGKRKKEEEKAKKRSEGQDTGIVPDEAYTESAKHHDDDDASPHDHIDITV